MRRKNSFLPHSVFWQHRKNLKTSKWPQIILTSLMVLATLSLLASSLSFGIAVSTYQTTVMVKDIFFVLDASKSMSWETFPESKVSKFDFIREPLTAFFESFAGNRRSFMVFSDQYRIVSLPDLMFSLAESGALDPVKGLKPTAKDGTNIAKALRVPQNIYRLSQTKSKVIVLITDLEDFRNDFMPVMEELLDEEIHLYVVGAIFSEESDKYRFDSSASLFDPIINEKVLLETFKSRNNFHYLRIEDFTRDYSSFQSSIDKLEGSPLAVERRHQVPRAYHLFGWLALSLLTVFAFLRSWFITKI